MSAEHKPGFLERNWAWFVIGYGVLFVACIDIFMPTN